MKRMFLMAYTIDGGEWTPHTQFRATHEEAVVDTESLVVMPGLDYNHGILEFNLPDMEEVDEPSIP